MRRRGVPLVTRSPTDAILPDGHVNNAHNTHLQVTSSVNCSLLKVMVIKLIVENQEIEEMKISSSRRDKREVLMTK